MCSVRKGVLRNIAKFTGKHLCRRLFLPATLLKKRLWDRCFPVNFVKFFKNTFYTEHLRTTTSVHCLMNSLKCLYKQISTTNCVDEV